MAHFRTAFVSGNFFILHPGHIRFLRFAASVCDKLIIGVRNTQPTDRYPTAEERIEALKALNLSAEVMLLEQPLEHYLLQIKPDAIVKGNEYRHVDNPESAVLAQWGGEIIFASGDANYVASDLLQADGEFNGSVHLLRPRSYIRRNRCDVDSLRSIVDRFNGLKVAVIGDLIVDEYIECEALGMSREDPTIVVSPVGSERYVGGAGIVAAHAKALGADTRFVGLISNDESGDFARQMLATHDVNVQAFSDSTRPTTLKRRYRCAGKTLLRVSHLSQEEPSPEIQNLIAEAAAKAVENADCAVLSDFSYGCLSAPVIDVVARIAAETGLVVSADSQSSSQTGDSTRFKGVSLLCATEYEARTALRTQTMGLSALGAELLKKSEAQNLIMKLGSAGLVFLQAEESPADLDRLPALNPNPVDVAGAGDSLLITATMALAVGATLAQAAYIGSIAAAIQVSRQGNIPLTQAELSRALH